MIRTTAAIAALVVGLAGLVPFAHVHAGAGGALIHRHMIDDAPAHHDDASHHDGVVDHDDHGVARVLSLAYDTSALFSLSHSVAVVTISAAEANPAIVRQTDRTTLLPTHDPPLRFLSSPAPPVSA